jgi:hypothetical protein
MNTLLSIRTNILYAKKAKKSKEDADEFIKHHELIFLVDKPKYTQTNGGEIIRERAVDELRFTVAESVFDDLLETLNTIKNAEENQLI